MKKLVFLLLFAVCINVTFAQIKPLKFGLVLKFDEASFDIKERKIAKHLFDTVAITLDKKLDSISKTKSMCVDYVGYKDISKATLLYVAHFYKGDSDEVKNVPIMDRFLMDNITKDTIKQGRLKGPWLDGSLSPEDHSVKSNTEFLRKNSAWITNQTAQELVLFVLSNYSPNCQDVLDYKRQKVSGKALIFLCNNTTVSNDANAKYSKIIDTFVNNHFISRWLVDEKKKRNRRFIFYPANKDTEKINPDVRIQLHLQEDEKGNYEITVALTGKEVNTKGPGGGEMKTSVKFNKKRLDSGDYTELVYKINDLIGGIYLYNFLL